MLQPKTGGAGEGRGASNEDHPLNLPALLLIAERIFLSLFYAEKKLAVRLESAARELAARAAAAGGSARDTRGGSHVFLPARGMKPAITRLN